MKNSYCTGKEGIEAFEQAQNMLQIEAGDDDQEQALTKDTMEDKSTDEGRNKPASNAQKKRSRHELEMGVTEEELEAYKKARTAAADPMAAFLGKDELVS